LVRVLYLFAGTKRRSGLAVSLRRAFKRIGIKVHIEEVDVLRGGAAHNLLSKTRQKRLLAKIATGIYALVAASPPCGTFSRARHANTKGPRPVRSRVHPRGLPWLQGAARRHVHEANVLVDFAVKAIAAQHLTNPGLTVLEHPEDLGRVPGGTPGTIWQLRKVRELTESRDVVTGAINQSEFGTTYPKPTRLLGRLPGLSKHMSEGWPTFDSEDYYLGPLSKSSTASARLIGQAGRSFATAASAAWPERLCDVIANLTATAIQQVDHKAAADPTERDPPIGSLVASAPAAGIPIQPSERRPKRRRITDGELATLAAGGDLERHEVYVGRGGRGVPPSKWGNPYKLSTGLPREAAVEEYRRYLSTTDLAKELSELAGKDLLCHCGPEEKCHADVLLAAAAEAERGQGQTEPATGDDLRTGGAAPLEASKAQKTPAPALNGWHGIGAPRTSSSIGGEKPYCDGGGLCSPGRWRPNKRRLPTSLPGLRQKTVELFSKAVHRTSGGADDARRFMLKLCTGRLGATPFAEEDLEGMRESLRGMIGMESSEDTVPEGQVFHLALIAKTLKAFGDPDWEFISGLSEGVALGVDQELPRMAAVFEEKEKWRLAEEPGPGSDARGNYKSVDPYVAEVRKLFREDEAQGWMEEIPEAVARERFGSRLAVAALGVVDEGEKIRVIHDGSNRVLVNHKIRVRDQTRCPSAGEIRTLMEERLAAGLKSLAVLGDVSKAHRRIKVQEKDWGLQACQIDPGYIWVNKVGTYGMGSAAYYWARFGAAALVRLGHYVAGPDGSFELLLYVDDFLMLPCDLAGLVFAGALIFLWTALGIPFKWAKCRGGDQVDWIGYWLSLWDGRLGISERRAAWLSNWMLQQVKGGRTDLAEFTSVLGRLSFSMGPLDHLRPFISPLFAWSAAMGHSGVVKVPWSVAFIFQFLADELMSEGRVATVRPTSHDLGVAFRADAKAEGQTVCLGGWECLGDVPPSRARWFSVELNKENAPWAFSRGEPFRVIAALELYATLLSVVLFGDAWPRGSKGVVRLQGITDNLGNAYVMTKMMSTKFPLVVVLAELAAQLRSRSMALSVAWVPREQNDEADALTNGVFTAFDASRRIEVDPRRIKWLVLPKMLETAEQLYKHVQEVKAGGGPPKAAAARPAASFRQRQPW